MTMNVFVVFLFVLCLFAVCLFLLKRQQYEFWEEQKAMAKEISELFDAADRTSKELQALKVQRDELEREERKVLDGMNNIMNYGFDVARKAARDGGEV